TPASTVSSVAMGPPLSEPSKWSGCTSSIRFPSSDGSFRVAQMLPMTWPRSMGRSGAREGYAALGLRDLGLVHGEAVHDRHDHGVHGLVPGQLRLPPARPLRHEYDLADARADGVHGHDEAGLRRVVELDLADELERHPDGLLVLARGPDGADDSA